MRKILLTAAIAGAVVVGCKHHKADKHHAEAKHTEEARHEEISFDQLPAKVQAAFLQKFPGATVKEVEKETYPDGQIHYEIEYVDASGKEHDVEIDADGEVLPEH